MMKIFVTLLVLVYFVFSCSKKESQAELNCDLLYITSQPYPSEFKDVVKLVKKGANVNGIDDKFTFIKGMTPLLNACYGIENDRGRFANQEQRLQSELEAVKIVKFLVEKGAKLDAENRKGSNALHLAAIGGRPHILQTLVDLGMDINEINKVGATPLILATASGSLEAVKVCLKNGAQINAKTRENATALDMALQYGSEYAQKMGMSEQNEHKEIVEYLKEKVGKKGE